EVCTDGDPDVAQPRRGAHVLDLFRPDAADVRDRSLDCANDLGDGDLVGRSRQPVAADDAALAADDARMAQVAEDVLQELERDLLRLRDSLIVGNATRGR